jgi:MoaA/NifB/PqqE/SkfB family radical SAM enzyme
MALDNFMKIVQILKAQKIFFLTLSGGEPFLHPQINDILKYAHHEFEYTTVLSNGTNINNENVECIKEIIKEKGFFPMQVSLDAIDPGTNNKTRGMTKKVLKNLEILNEANISLTIAIVVTSQNVEQVIQTIIATKHLTNHFHIMPFKSVPFLEQEDQYLRLQQPDMQKIWESLKVIRDKHALEISLPSDHCDVTQYSATGAPCVAGFTQIVIDPNLDVRACSRCPHAIVGNLDNESIESIWNGPRLAHIYNQNIPYCYIQTEWESAFKNPIFMAGKRGVNTGQNFIAY